MIDALGRPQDVLVLGGTSEIALAVVRALPPERLRRVVLAGRDLVALGSAAAELDAALGGRDVVSAVRFEALDAGSHGPLLEGLFAAGDVDVVVLAFGALGDQQAMEDDPLAAVELARVNYVGALSTGLAAGRLLAAQGHGVLVVLSSVAALRPRRSQYVYASTKAGVDSFARGLAEAMRGSGARVLLVRPGFVRTRMTRGRPEAPFAVEPADVGDAVARALRRGRGQVYAPTAVGPLMLVVRALPRWVLRRLPG